MWHLPELPTLPRVYKIGAVAIGLLAIYGAGYLTARKTIKPVVVTQVVEKKVEVQGATKIVYKDRVVTRVVQTTKKPDGTVVTKELDRTEDRDKDTDKKVTKDVAAHTETPKVVPPPADEGDSKAGAVVGAVIRGVIGFFATGGIGTHAAATAGGAIGGGIGAWLGDWL